MRANVHLANRVRPVVASNGPPAIDL